MQCILFLPDEALPTKWVGDLIVLGLVNLLSENTLLCQCFKPGDSYLKSFKFGSLLTKLSRIIWTVAYVGPQFCSIKTTDLFIWATWGLGRTTLMENWY